MSPEIILYNGNKSDADLQQKWDLYSRYICLGSDLLNKDGSRGSGSASQSSGTISAENTTGGAIQEHAADAGIPEKIASMLAMYEFGDGSFRQKCLNFIRQGKFMEDYEDDAPWYGDLRSYFPVYHDLNIRQLRGYFSWRTAIRKGAFKRTCPAFAYIYIYELLNGIGVKDASESVDKLIAFRDGYIETGMGDITLKSNLRRWLFEFAVIHLFPESTAGGFVEKSITERDHALAVLRDPGQHDDEEVFQAIRRFASSGTALTTVLTKDRSRGVRLFAEIWRHIAHKPAADGKDIFTLCFGEKETKPWHPLANAVYMDRDEPADMDFHLDECRRYFCRGGKWQEESYNALSGDRSAFMAMMHSADRRLRTMLKSGHYLHQKAGDESAMPYIDAALKEIQAEEAEAARPKITVDLSCLDRIREDADITRDSLLTEYDTVEAESPDTAYDNAEAGTPDAAEDTSGAEISDTDDKTAETEVPDTAGASAAPAEPVICGLNALQSAVLKELVAGRSVKALMEENHLMPEVVADSINEALIDEIGDSVVECTEAGLSIVDDYMDELIALTGVQKNA